MINYKQLNAKRMSDLGGMDKLLERSNLPRLNQEEIKKVNGQDWAHSWW